MAEEVQSWKQVLDRKLERLHSLLFGVEAAIEGEEWEKALGLGLCLLGFLQSQSITEEDRIYIAPIKKLVEKQIDNAKDKLYQVIEINAVPQALFGKYQHHRLDISRITNSRFYKPFMPSENTDCSSKMDIDPPTNVSAPFGKLPHEDSSVVESKKRRNICDLSSELRRSTMPLDKQKKIVPSFKQRIPATYPSEEKVCDENAEDETVKSATFVTAKQKWAVDSLKKSNSNASAVGSSSSRTLGVPRRGVRGSFIPPLRSNGTGGTTQRNEDTPMNDSTSKCLELLAGPDGELPDKLRNLEPRLLEHISNEIMEKDSNVRWDDIAGLDHAKKSVTEMVIWPLLRPDIFHGCRSPGKGLLLFGPPGTGKTMIGKAIASEAKATFFSISASSLTSKWIGEGEKLVRALFGVASCRQPAVIFMDEVDSLLSQRKSEGEHESSRRIKTQFLIEMEGIGSGNEQLLLIGATNRPQELDEAARRRFSKRLYIPLPSSEARGWIVRNLLQKDGLLSLSSSDIDAICSMTEGYSGSDMKNLVKEASMFPLREALKSGKDISKLSNDEMRAISLQDFVSALHEVKPSVSKCELGTYEDWNSQFGSLSL